MKIFLIGYRCTGKTTIGKMLALHLNFEFLDTDRLLEENAGSSIREIVEQKGWDAFRQMEKLSLLSTKNNQYCVISTGGGIILDPENQEFIVNSGVSIWLEADLKTILLRLNQDPETIGSRPSLTNKNLIKETQELLTLRKPIYKKTAHIRIDTSFHTPEEILNIIDRRLKDVRQ